MGNDKRYHAEVKVITEGRDARINIFADTLDEVFMDLNTICCQYPIDGQPTPATPAPQPSPKPAPARPAPAPAPAPRPTPNHNKTPECSHCGNNLFMELISFTDKKTGAPRSEWKCQECNGWHFPPKR